MRQCGCGGRDRGRRGGFPEGSRSGFIFFRPGRMAGVRNQKNGTIEKQAFNSGEVHLFRDRSPGRHEVSEYERIPRGIVRFSCIRIRWGFLGDEEDVLWQVGHLTCISILIESHLQHEAHTGSVGAAMGCFCQLRRPSVIASPIPLAIFLISAFVRNSSRARLLVCCCSQRSANFPTSSILKNQTKHHTQKP